MDRISTEKLESLKANIYPRAHGAVDDWEQIDWHRDRSGVVDSDVPHSSQAFCISVWGSLVGHSDALGLRLLREAVGLGDEWVFLDREADLEFEYADGDILNELGYGKPTNIDALLSYGGHVVTVESKLTESFGSCSQVPQGSCTGAYEPGSDLKTDTEAPCRLQVADGRRTPRKYWDVMARLCVPGTFRIGEPCPYSGPAYQVMRNIAFAAELGRMSGRDWRVLLAFPASADHDASAIVDAVIKTLTVENKQRVATVDYDRVADGLQASDSEPAAALGSYMATRLGHVR